MEALASRATIAVGLVTLAAVRLVLKLFPEPELEDAVPLDPDLLYELCDCPHGAPCSKCWDSLLVPHDHDGKDLLF